MLALNTKGINLSRIYSLKALKYGLYQNIKEMIKELSNKQINRISKIIKGVSENISRISENIKCIYLE